MEPEHKLSTFEKGIEWINWLKIALSPAIFFGVIAFVVKILMNNQAGNFLFGFILSVGVFIGIIWANKIKKKHGSTHFISRTDASPDIDEMLQNKANKK